METQTIPTGWTEAYPGGLICSSAPNGGIIDFNMVDHKWFIIFNDDTDSIEGLDSRDEAIKIFLSKMERN